MGSIASYCWKVVLDFFFVKWFGTCEIVWLGKFHRFETFGCEFSKRTAVMASQLIFFEEVNVNSRLPSKYKRSQLNKYKRQRIDFEVLSREEEDDGD